MLFRSNQTSTYLVKSVSLNHYLPSGSSKNLSRYMRVCIIGKGIFLLYTFCRKQYVWRDGRRDYLCSFEALSSHTYEICNIFLFSRYSLYLMGMVCILCTWCHLKLTFSLQYPFSTIFPFLPPIRFELNLV